MAMTDNDRPQKSRSHLFMLRYWQEDLGNEETDWRGKIQHVNSGEALYFREWQMLVAFIEDHLLMINSDAEGEKSN